MKTEVSVTWLNDMSFEADVDGHKIILDANVENGGHNRGSRPKPLMLVALAGCTGMDVVSILSKMRVDVEDLVVKVEGNTVDEHPKRYIDMKIVYYVKGKDIDYEKVKKAVELSQEKYCGVSAFYKEVIDLDYEIRIN